MRLRELLYLLGWPRPAARSYGHEVVTFDLPDAVSYTHLTLPTILLV